MENLYIILGNGFSLDIVNKLKKCDKIDLINLFSKGGNVKFPKTEQKGFLSRKYCPNLWTLGARTTMDNKSSIELITDILTCANVYNLSLEKKPVRMKESNKNIYIDAYNELTTYLRYLFVYYNSLISDDDLMYILPDIELLQYIKKYIASDKKVVIITYNYDILLERILCLSNIEYSILGFEKKDAQIEIFKPHGSISFSFSIKVQETSPYIIKYAIDDTTQEAKDFNVIYNLENDYPIVNAIIPPAGDSNRYNYGWIRDIRKGIEESINKTGKGDEIILFGISYWHVDRSEIDEILLNANSEIELKYVNPSPPTSFDAVLSSLFEKYVHYSSASLLI